MPKHQDWRKTRDKRYKKFHEQKIGLSAWIGEKLVEQHGCCRICKRRFGPDRPYVVDHDHSCCKTIWKSCGKCWRGLLCVRCNTAQGYFQDSIRMLAEDIVYLQEYEARRKGEI